MALSNKTYSDTLKKLPDFDRQSSLILEKTSADVELALNRASNNRALELEHLAALLSPAAEKFIEPMARLSHDLTRCRFGNTIQLFAPLYLSNECQNICNYCGFSFGNKLPRRTLNKDEILKEVEILKEMGFQHVLVVTGEANQLVGMPYFREVMPLLSEHFPHISFEVQPLNTDQYQELVTLGLDAVLVYQETYDQLAYKREHPRGKKSNFFYRLETPDRLAQASVEKIGLGCLLGLSDWRADAWNLGAHLKYLRETYWRSRYSVAFPRLQPAEGLSEERVRSANLELVQLISAFRLFDSTVEISLSTRESSNFRDEAVNLGVTTLSAASRTEPGGYAEPSQALEQFETDDSRSVPEVCAMLERKGLSPVFKDWEAAY